MAAGIDPLLRIAADLRTLPRESFKARLKSEFEGRKAYVYRCRTRGSRSHDCLAKISVPGSGQSNRVLPRAHWVRKKLSVSRLEDSIPHAEIMIGDSSIAVTGEWPEGGRFSAETLGNSPISTGHPGA